MTLGERLRQSRNRAGLTQLAVAQQLSAPRELISMWENDTRVPSRRQLDTLAQILLVTKGYLLGIEKLTGDTMEKMLFRHYSSDNVPQEVRKGIDEWTNFLSDWSDFLGDEAPGSTRPPREFENDRGTVDVRRASSLASKVRAVYGLGEDALPDMYGFLDKQNILVYRSDTLPSYNRDNGISGAFYNHPVVGFCIFVNTATTLGRQAFTLAHEFGHALFHYSEKGLISSRLKPTSANNRSEYASFERFADAFAAHFLVPGIRLRTLWKNFQNESISNSHSAIMLAAHFRVSYAMLLFRLLNEALITPREFQECKELSPTDLAKKVGLDVTTFKSFHRQFSLRHSMVSSSEEGLPRELRKFPPSVLERVVRAIEKEGYDVEQAAGLLGTDILTITNKLLAPPRKAKDKERRHLNKEFKEYPITNYAVLDEAKQIIW